jgi:hypothetical protein
MSVLASNGFIVDTLTGAIKTIRIMEKLYHNKFCLGLGSRITITQAFKEYGETS